MGDLCSNKELLIDLGDIEDDKTKTSHNETAEDASNVQDNSDIEHKKSDISTSDMKNEDHINLLKRQKLELEENVKNLQMKLDNQRNELEREVQRRFEMEQRFTEDAKRSSDQIEELISKSNQDDAKIMEFHKRIEYYAEETSSMIESFTTNREVLSSQLQQLRYENDFLLGKFLAKSRDLQNEVIDLPQTVDELQFYCLRITEKLILATLARERLEESLVQAPPNRS